jgi:hypothetical protein
MGNIQKGSKVPFTLAVDANSLGGSSLKDSDFKVDFYAQVRKEAPISAYFTVNKADAVKDAEDDNTYYMICDTTNLDLGVIGATLEVTYTDANTNKEAKEIITLTTQDKIIEKQQPTQGE